MNKEKRLVDTNDEVHDKGRKGLSRREFLKSATVSVAAAGGASLLAGCGPQEASGTPEAEVTEAAEAAAPAAAAVSFETAPDPIPEDQIAETVDAEVVVVGAGVSGLMAALAAAEQGANTVLIEKTSSFNARGGHNAALGSKLQKAEGIDYDGGEVVRKLARWGGNKVNQSLLMLWADNCNETIDYLIDMAEANDIEVTIWGNDIPDAFYSEYKTVHMFGGMDEKILAGMVEQAAKDAGADFHYEMPAAQLVRDGSGSVEGVIAGEEGSYTRFNASKGVILCTGDYGNNPEMVERYCPKANDITMNVYAPAVNTGDGHKMGLWVGAAMQEDEPHTPMIHNLGGPQNSSHPFLRVDKFGNRYENEDVPIPYLCNSIQLLPDNIEWTIFDSTWEEYVPHMGSGFSRSPVVTEDNVASLDEAVEAGTMAFKADTIEGLAEQIGVPADALQATIDRYNELVAAGEDTDFGKSPEMMTAIDTAPYYAVTNPLALLVVLGGLRVNTDLQVLNANSEVIPGLYAAGNVVGECFANDYPVIVPGLSHSRALVFGRLAGQSAAG